MRCACLCPVCCAVHALLGASACAWPPAAALCWRGAAALSAGLRWAAGWAPGARPPARPATADRGGPRAAPAPAHSINGHATFVSRHQDGTRIPPHMPLLASVSMTRERTQDRRPTPRPPHCPPHYPPLATRSYRVWHEYFKCGKTDGRRRDFHMREPNRVQSLPALPRRHAKPGDVVPEGGEGG
jgi:hypothetical protein